MLIFRYSLSCLHSNQNLNQPSSSLLTLLQIIECKIIKSKRSSHIYAWHVHFQACSLIQNALGSCTQKHSDLEKRGPRMLLFAFNYKEFPEPTNRAQMVSSTCISWSQRPRFKSVTLRVSGSVKKRLGGDKMLCYWVAGFTRTNKRLGSG